jgi:hypothetical protein
LKINDKIFLKNFGDYPRFIWVVYAHDFLCISYFSTVELIMKKLLILIVMLFSFMSFSQDIQYKEYSYSDFFKLIENEKDTVFKLENALIIYNNTTDARFEIDPDTDSNINKVEKLIIDKKIELTNVQFLIRRIFNNGKYYTKGVLKNIHFKEDVNFSNVKVMSISDCIFNGKFLFNTTNCDLKKLSVDTFSPLYINIENSFFYNRFNFAKSCEERLNNESYIHITKNYFASDEQNLSFNLNLKNSVFVDISENNIQNKGSINLNFEGVDRLLNFIENKIIANQSYLNFSSVNRDLDIKNNSFSSLIYLGIDELKTNYKISWQEFKNKLIDGSSVLEYSYKKTNKQLYFINPKKVQELMLKYLDSVQFYNKDIYSSEISLRGTFYDYYKSKYDTETANEVYTELKDLETKRMEALYIQHPSFKTFFTWKTNQFLKVFSAYGTEPAKAIIYSVYVIILFAIIYLFFPNYWDSHGKNRIRDRFLFFQKYLRHPKGIHDVYLDERKTELEEAYQFQQVLDKYKTEVPNIFYQAAKPLHKWSVAGTLLYARLLSKIDFLKGSWKDTDPKVRVLKTSLTLVIFFIALLYDIFIKMLNALMLSINTFTTLGFGEIPIKGLPRYLAIIQGFIGWFMLTIFSVSLISQLLN